MPDPFLEHRKRQEQDHLRRTVGDQDPMGSLITLEMNITELCNRTCVFCPRADPKVYPNQNLHMPVATAEKVAGDLASLRYRGRVSFSGFGEPFLHKSFLDILRAFRRRLPETVLETNTNGDQLNPEKVRQAFAAGLTNIYVNLYDGAHQKGPFEIMMAAADVPPERYTLRDHWMGPGAEYGLNLNNRSGMVHMEGERPPEELRGKPCHYPFYKMIVDWDGKVLFCSNDWGRKIVVGNVLTQHVRDIWLSPEMAEVRARLMKGDRSVSPCDTCNVVGTLHGKSSFDLLVAHYQRTGGAR